MAETLKEQEKLRVYIQNEDVQKVEQTVNKLLEQNGSDVKLTVYKMNLNLRQKKYSSVVELYEKIKNNTTGLGYEEYYLAFAYYNMNEYKLALDIINEALSRNKDLPVATEFHYLKIQIYYNTMQYENAVNEVNLLKKHLAQKNIPNIYEFELDVNLKAINAIRGFFPDTTFDGSDMGSFEEYFNASCFYAYKGDMINAEKKLNESVKLFEKYANEERLTEVELKEEQSLFDVQRFYIEGDRRTDLNAILKNVKPSNHILRLICMCNSIDMKNNFSAAELDKKIKALLKEYNKARKLSFHQKVVFIYKIFGLLLKKNLSSKEIEEVKSEYFEKLSQIKKQYIVDGDPVLVGFCDSYERQMRCMYAAHTESDEAMLEKLKTNEFKLVASVRSALLIDKIKGAKMSDVERSEFVRKVDSFNDDWLLIQFACDSDLRKTDVELIQNHYKKNKEEKKKIIILQYLVRAASKLNMLKDVFDWLNENKIVLSEKKIGEIKDVNLKELKKSVDEFVSTVVKQQPEAVKEKEKEKRPRKKRNQKKKRLAKKIVLDGNVDPERWLPFYERSTYKPKKKKSAKKGAAQGAATTSAEVEKFGEINQKPAAAKAPINKNKKNQHRKKRR